jgi:ubiquitin C-terminal hydrolase
VGSPINGIKKFFLSRSYVEGSRKDTEYSLVGFSVYTGDAKKGTSGHWYSYRKIGKKYYELNDSTVRQFSEEEFFRIASTSARHLVYRKKT